MSKNKPSIGIYYGILASNLQGQAAAQGFVLTRAEEHQANIEAVHRLYMNDYITESEKDKIFQRIHKNICRDCRAVERKEYAK